MPFKSGTSPYSDGADDATVEADDRLEASVAEVYLLLLLAVDVLRVEDLLEDWWETFFRKDRGEATRRR